MEFIPGLNRPGKIVCVGRNYALHAAELGNELPTEPLLFLKPPSAVVYDGETIVLPPQSRQVEHEAEIGVVIGATVRNIDSEEAEAAIAGYVCVNDVTARDLQRTDKQWTRAKGFDTFCAVGPAVVPLEPGRWRELEVIGRVNGVERQHGEAADMHFGIPAIVAYIASVMTLEPGDLIATGTPAGVGPLTAGDIVEIEIPGIGTIANPVVGPGA